MLLTIAVTLLDPICPALIEGAVRKPLLLF
jgi:hypothetical protein